MTVQELIEKLQHMPHNMEVFVKNENHDYEFDMEPVEEVSIDSVLFHEGDGKKGVHAYEDCVILRSTQQ